jgi:hypothetical protein
MGPTRIPKTRRDGWTAERQLRFLDALAATRSVAKAAASAGMSREGAYRLRNRSEGTLFAALWDCALAPAIDRESQTLPLTDGRLMRLLGNHYRRETSGFCRKGHAKDRIP